MKNRHNNLTIGKVVIFVILAAMFLSLAACESDDRYPMQPIPSWWEVVAHVNGKGHVYLKMTVYKDTRSCNPDRKSLGLPLCRHYLLQGWGVHNNTLIEIDYVPSYEDLNNSLNRIASANG
jgi:hypothetical protein